MTISEIGTVIAKKVRRADASVICLKFVYETLMKERKLFQRTLRGSTIIFPISIDEGDPYPYRIFTPIPPLSFYGSR